jgi:Uma2 family endonuclease
MHYSYAEYLLLEEMSSVRHEYLDGEIYARPGGTPDHAALAFSLSQIIGGQLRQGCRGFSSDLRVRIVATGLSTYPDGLIVCGGTQRAGDDALAVVNPTALVEVTSKSTEDYDRGEKLRHYQTIPSLREVLIVSHREPRLTVHRRGTNGSWISIDARAGESISLESVGAVIRVDDVDRDGLEDI